MCGWPLAEQAAESTYLASENALLSGCKLLVGQGPRASKLGEFAGSRNYRPTDDLAAFDVEIPLSMARMYPAVTLASLTLATCEM